MQLSPSIVQASYTFQVEKSLNESEEEAAASKFPPLSCRTIISEPDTGLLKLPVGITPDLNFALSLHSLSTHNTTDHCCPNVLLISLHRVPLLKRNEFGILTLLSDLLGWMSIASIAWGRVEVPIR